MPNITQEPQSEGQDGSLTRGQLDGGIGDQSIEIAADAEIIPEWNTRTVFEALEPMCAVCHGEGQSSPYFASLSISSIRSSPMKPTLYWATPTRVNCCRCSPEVSMVR